MTTKEKGIKEHEEIAPFYEEPNVEVILNIPLTEESKMIIEEVAPKPMSLIN